MSLTTAYAISLIGLVALTLGANWLVDGASRIASYLGVSSLVIGLTVVAYGTSAPEMMASVVAAVQNHADVTIGNVVGSNVANIGLILGLTAAVTPFAVAASVLKRELPMMLAVTVLFYVVARGLVFSRWIGAGFLVGLVIFNLVSFYWAKGDGVDSRPAEAERGSLKASVTKTLLGLAMLLGGAHLLVSGAVSIAQAYGLSDFIIGLTLVAVGTSLPELATSLAAGLKGQTDLIVGNLIGSNLFNILGAIGLSALIKPVEVNPNLLQFEFIALLAFSFAMAFVLSNGKRVHRWEGFILVIGYVGFIVYLFV